MSNYSDNPYMCRVDFFKPSGKWGYTEAVSFEGLGWDNGLLTSEVVAIAILRHCGERMKGMKAVVLEPYCKHPYPIMWDVPE